MDRLQKWLMEKEKISPSTGGYEPATLVDGLKFSLRNAFRKVEYVNPKNYSEGSEKEDDWSRDYYSRYPKTMDLNSKGTRDEERFKLARGRLMEAIRKPEIWYHFGRQDNLESSLKNLGYLWEKNGWPKFSLPRKKIMELRRRAINGEIESLLKTIDSLPENECLALGDYTKLRDRLELLYSSAEMPFETRTLDQRFLEGYSTRGKTLDLETELGRYPGHSVIHGVPEDSKKGSLSNNHVLNTMGQHTWEDFLQFALDKRPALSCSSINPSSNLDAFYSRVGVIIGGGKVFNASPRDLASQTFHLKVKLPIGGRGTPLRERSITRDFDEALQNGRDHYNEIIVGEPAITGLFYHEGEQPIGSGMILHKPLLGNPREDAKAIQRLHEIGKERGLPVYRFQVGKGFVESISSESFSR